MKQFYTVHGTGMIIPVRVLNSRKAYGRNDVLITPIGGSGQCWVNSTKLTQNAVTAVPQVLNEATKNGEKAEL
jgi:hypothetical protein